METQTTPRRITPRAAKTYASADDFTTLTPRELCDLRYFAGCLTAVKTELARIQHRSDTPADVLEYWREELQAAQNEFNCEWDKLETLHEERSEFAGHKEPSSASGRRQMASDAHSVAKRRLFAVLNQHAPKLSRDARLRLLSDYLRRDIKSTQDCTVTDLHDCATDVDCGRIAVGLYV